MGRRRIFIAHFKSLGMNFDFVAPFYDRLSQWVFGDLLAQSRRTLLDELTVAPKVLILGGGSGDMLFGLAERQIGQEVTYIESSSKFVALARQAWQKNFLGSDIAINWQQSTWQAYEATEKFDLITTDYFLDLFRKEEVQQFVQKISNHLEPNGYWLYIDFCQNEATAWWWQTLRVIMYRFFGLVAGVPGREIQNVRKIAGEIGLEIVAEKQMARHGIEAILFRKVL